MTPKGCLSVELQEAIDLEEVKVRAHLNGSVAGVAYLHLAHPAPSVVLHVALCEHHTAYGAGWGGLLLALFVVFSSLSLHTCFTL